MKKINIVLIVTLLLLSNLVSAQKASSTSQEAIAVKEFGMSIVKSYFKHDCNFAFDRLHTSITSFEGGQTIKITPEMRQLFCQDDPLRTDIKVSYDMYQDNYTPEILNINQMDQKYPEWVAHVKMEKGDYFFFGGKVKAAGATRLFKASDVARFLVRKINGSWKIVAI